MSGILCIKYSIEGERQDTRDGNLNSFVIWYGNGTPVCMCAMVRYGNGTPVCVCLLWYATKELNISQEIWDGE